jgi:phage FluMu protein Com
VSGVIASWRTSRCLFCNLGFAKSNTRAVALPRCPCIVPLPIREERSAPFSRRFDQSTSFVVSVNP